MPSNPDHQGNTSSFYSKATKMKKLTEKEVIHFIIEMHQKVTLSGGVSCVGWFHSALLRRQHSLLRMFKLPITVENLKTTVTYPFSLTTDSLLNEAWCRLPNGFEKFPEPPDRRETFKITRVADACLMEIQSEYVYGRLMKLAALHEKNR